MSDLEKAALELRQLQQTILGLSNLKDKEEMAKKVRQLDFDQETAVMNLLEKTDKLYDSIVQENFDVLINDRIEFNATQEEIGVSKSHAIKFDGKVNDDGLFHCHTTETDFVLLNFYPLSYVGLINYFGEADIYMDRKKYSLFESKIPKKFLGSINTKGGLSLEATESFEERPGKIYVNNMVADLFSGNLEKREKFLSNKSHLKKIINDYRNDLG